MTESEDVPVVGQHLRIRELESGPYIRIVELVALDTACKLGGFEMARMPLGPPTFNIYTRRYQEEPEVEWVARCRDVDLIPGPAWKIGLDGRYPVDELGNSTKSGASGMEY
jgi:hypothetical protein